MIKKLIEADLSEEDYLERFPYVSMDTETDGTDVYRNEVVEVTAIEFNLKGEVGRNFTRLCRNKSGIMPEDVIKVHGITTEMMIGKPSFYKSDNPNMPSVREQLINFIQRRTVVGQNLWFDTSMTKIRPVATEDTLKMSRSYWALKKGNTLKDICIRLGFEWDDSQAHRSEYDVRMTILAFVNLKQMLDIRREENSVLPLFRDKAPEEIISKEIPVDEYIEKETDTGVILPEKHKKMIASQAYSYSRLKLYLTCPLKWYNTYILGKKESSAPLKIGITCHEIADLAAKWCYLNLFVNKFQVAMKNKIIKPVVKMDELRTHFSFSGDVTYRMIAEMLYKRRQSVQYVFGISYLDLIRVMDSELSMNEYEIPGMPPHDEYRKIITECFSKFNIVENDIMSEVSYIMRRFYQHHDFSLYPGDVVVTEKALAFDRDWNLVEDFYGDNVFWRGKIDKIRWEGDIIDIEDYKTNRVIPTLKELQEDMQLKSYLMCVVSYLGRENVEVIRIRLNYLRHNKSLEIVYAGDEIDDVIKEVRSWISATVAKVERHITGEKNVFAPKRNEYCSSCSLFLDGKCSLFDISKIKDVESDSFIVMDTQQCIDLYKQAELLEIKRAKILKACSTYVKNNDDDIILIDGNAELNFHPSDKVVYDTYTLVTELLKRKGSTARDFELKDILHHLSISKSNVEKISKAIGLNISELTTPGIKKESISHKFTAKILEKNESQE